MAVEYYKQEYGPDKWKGHLFGFGTYHFGQQPIPKDRLQVLKTARLLGWSSGCPIAAELTNSQNTQYGPSVMLQRYDEVNQWFTLITKIAKDEDYLLYQQLTTPTLRLPGEPVGKHEHQSVPGSHLEQISPMSCIYGYATPRVVITLTTLETIPTRAGRTMRAVDVAKRMVKKAQTPAELLALTAEKTALIGVEPTQVLQHTLAQGVLEEENCRTAYINLANFLEDKAPNLMRAYLGLTTTEKTDLKIAEIPQR